MTPIDFISHSSADGLDFALRIREALATCTPARIGWVDKCEIRSGFDWDWQLEDALKECQTLLFVMTPDSVADTSPCKEEWTRVLSYKKPVIPLLFVPKVPSPFGLGRRQYVDFTGNFQEGFERLRTDLQWLTGTLEGQRMCLKYRLEDAQRDLSRAASESRRSRAQGEIDHLTNEVARLEEAIANPEENNRRVEEGIQLGLERERRPSDAPIFAVRKLKFVNQPPIIPPSYFQNRLIETGILAKFVKDPATRMITVIGRGGVGKTALACRFLEQIRADHSESTEKVELDGIVYLSCAGSRGISFPAIFEDLCQLLTPEQLPSLAAIYKTGDLTATRKTSALLDRFPSGQYILLLDNFEDKLDPSTGAITEKELDEALCAFLNHQPHGIKVLLTTRIRPADLLLVGPGRQIVLDLDKGLESPFAENVLREMDREGTLGLKAAPESLLSQVRQRVLGYPRALEAFYAILAADRSASIADILRDTERLPANVVEVLVGEAFNRLDAPAERVMQGLAIYNQPIPAVALDYLLKDHLPIADTAPILRRLVNMHFVRREGDRFYLHPIDRTYALSRIPLGSEDDRWSWDYPFTRFALCARAAEYYLEIQKPREDWLSLQDLAPQLARFELLLEGKDWDTALALLREVYDAYLLRWGHYALVLDLAGRLASYLEPSQESNRLEIVASAHFDKGYRNASAEYYEKAYLLASQVGNDFEKVRLKLTWQLALSESLGDEKGNIRAAREALQYARRRGGLLQWQALSHQRIGLAFKSLGKYSHALRHQRRALQICQESNDIHGEEGEWHNIGSCLYGLGEINQAREHYERALALSEKTGDPNWRANHLSRLGDCAFTTGATVIAQDFYLQVLGIRQEIGDRFGESADLSAVASCLSRFGEIDQALEKCHTALAIASELGNRGLEGSTLCDLSHLLIDAGEFPEARKSLATSIEIGLERGIPLVNEYSTLAFACILEGDLTAAKVALVHGSQYDAPKAKDYREFIRGVVALREGDTSLARECFYKAITCADALLIRTSTLVNQLQNRALALCGLVLSGLSDHLADSLRAFRVLRTVNRDPGVIASDIQHLNALAFGQTNDLFGPIRNAAIGQ